jgi:hypothetical protein
MPASAVVLILDAALLLSGKCAAKAPEARFSEQLAIVYSFSRGASPIAFSAMKRELELLFHIPGLRIEWRDLENSPAGETFDHLAVVRFRGECRMDVLTKPPRSDPLGFAHSTAGAILPFAEINCESIRNLIRPVIARESSPKMDYFLGRAMARVLAHELYHILAQTRSHSGDGIAQAVFNARDLVTSRLEFTMRDREALRVKVLPQRTANADAGAGF